MRNIKLVIEYIGTNYCGFQTQKNQLTIQQVIEQTLERFLHDKVDLIASGRTDAGVHAIGLVANFHTCSTVPIHAFIPGLNSMLPSDIVVKSATIVDNDFHARYSSVGKVYRYLIYNDPAPSVFLDKRAHWVGWKLDYRAMQEASKYLVGKHDFKSFCASGGSVKTTTRTIYKATLRKKGKLLLFEIRGNGFLYNMVRIIVGTLIEVGKGRLRPEQINDIIAAKARDKAGPTAPPWGLYLVEVNY